MSEQTYEIMAPVGSYESLAAAIKAGADSIYFGIAQLNMRARAANNFTFEDLKKIVSICQEANVKTYLTVNTIMYDHDIKLLYKICDTAKKAGITAIIATDVAALMYAKSINLEIHISTQANITNIESVKFYAGFADVVVLARELTLAQIKYIVEQIKEQKILGPKGKLVEVEIFAHGALCTAISGKCYMSLGTYNASANRGACLQNCRRSYKVIDEETGDELRLENNYIMSPKDLCTIGFLDELLKAGVKVLKIEGRGRSPDYVAIVAKCYKEACIAVLEGTYTKEKIEDWTKQLSTVYNRGFWHGGYYLGKQLGEWSGRYGSQATKEKIFLGLIENYYSKAKVFLAKIQAGHTIAVGDEFLITGPTTGVVTGIIESIQIEGKTVNQASKGMSITIACEETVRENDKFYKYLNRSEDDLEKDEEDMKKRVAKTRTEQEEEFKSCD